MNSRVDLRIGLAAESGALVAGLPTSSNHATDHLRSMKEVHGYRIAATDGEIGHSPISSSRMRLGKSVI